MEKIAALLCNPSEPQCQRDRLELEQWGYQVRNIFRSNGEVYEQGNFSQGDLVSALWDLRCNDRFVLVGDPAVELCQGATQESCAQVWCERFSPRSDYVSVALFSDSCTAELSPIYQTNAGLGQETLRAASQAFFNFSSCDDNYMDNEQLKEQLALVHAEAAYMSPEEALAYSKSELQPVTAKLLSATNSSNRLRQALQLYHDAANEQKAIIGECVTRIFLQDLHASNMYEMLEVAAQIPLGAQAASAYQQLFTYAIEYWHEPIQRAADVAVAASKSGLKNKAGEFFAQLITRVETASHYRVRAEQLINLAQRIAAADLGLKAPALLERLVAIAHTIENNELRCHVMAQLGLAAGRLGLLGVEEAIFAEAIWFADLPESSFIDDSIPRQNILMSFADSLNESRLQTEKKAEYRFKLIELAQKIYNDKVRFDVLTRLGSKT